MANLKKMFVLVMITAVVLLGTMACNNKSEPAPSEPALSENPSSENPAGDHPSGEHPAGDTAGEQTE